MNKRIILLTALSFIIILLTAFIGMVHLNLSTLFSPNEQNFIFWRLRLPRALMAFMVGSVLALSGFIFQSLFNNDLATPYTLGISSGASLGVVLAIKLHLGYSLFGLNTTFLAGFSGALACVGILFAMARVFKNYSIYLLLLGGTALNFFFSSISIFIQYILDFSGTFSILRWLMGGIHVSDYSEVAVASTLAVMMMAFTVLFRRELMLLSAGDRFANIKGLDATRFRNLALVLVSFIIGSVVAMVGPIGFIGLMVPHISRLLSGKDLNKIIIHTFYLGGVLLLLTDFLARVVMAPVEIPVGIITAFFGAPFFLWILVRSLKKQ